MNILIKNHDSRTWTEWAWFEIRKSLHIDIPSQFVWFSNLPDYQNYLRWKYSQAKINQYFWEFLWKLDILKEKLNELYANKVDSISYLFYLYYIEWIDIRWISNRLKYLFDIDFPARSLNQNMTKNLLWKLRDKNEWTDITKRKDRKKVESRNYTSEKNKTQKINELIDLLTSTKWKQLEFDKIEYNKRKNNTEKMKYLMDIFWYIQESEFENTILRLRKSHSARIIADAFQQIINWELIRNWIKITVSVTNQRISEILKQKIPS